MAILSILFKSLKESFIPKRFYPFFLLYFLLFISSLIFLLPIIKTIPNFSLAYFSDIKWNIIGFNIISLLTVFTIFLFIRLWFTVSLVLDVHQKKGFEASMKLSKKVYWQTFAFFLIILILSTILSFLDIIGSFVQFLIDWFLFFTIPAIVIKKDTFENAMRRSFNLVKNNKLKTLAFWITTEIFNLVILIIPIILVILFLFPFFTNMATMVKSITQTEFGMIYKEELVQVAGLLLDNYPLFLLASIFISLGLSIAYVFVYTARTYYFLEFSKRRH